MNTKEKIIKKVKHNYSTQGYEGVRIRKLAKELDIAQSVIYHYFKNQNKMLEEVFDTVRKDLGKKRSKLPNTKNIKAMLRQRIDFQFESAADVIFILKYYTQYRTKFRKNPQGYVPVLAYKHIKEVMQEGVGKKEFENKEIDSQAKVITHAINGFILEYYPKIPTKKNRNKLVNDITNFIYRGIKKKGGEKNGRK